MGAEEGKVSEIHAEIKKLADTGPAGGEIGTMPTSVIAAAKIALTDLVETSASKTDAKQKAINLLQRGHAKITEITGAFKVLSSAITAERKKDTDAVDAQKKIVAAANKVYEISEGTRVAKLNAKDEADHRVVVAKTVVKHEEDEFTKAQKIRDDDIAIINKAMAAIDELIAVEKVRDMITAMLSDVEQEEKMQKMILDMMKAKYDQALAAHTAAVAAYDAQKVIYKKAHDKWEQDFGKYNNAESALSAEIAVAEQERRTINAVREMLTKIQSAEADVLGSCPLDKLALS